MSIEQNLFEHILIPKVLHHTTCKQSGLVKAVGLTIGVEIRENDTLHWNEEGFIEFLEEHLLDYCFTPDGSSSTENKEVFKRAKQAYDFLRKYCDRWKKGKIEGEEFDKDYRPIQGVLGEWFLHSFSKGLFNTKNLYSKVYLHQGKDAVHGFDIVHYKSEENADGFSLWLGEAKFHETLSSAVTSALNSLKKACSYEYLKSQERESGTKGEVAFIARYATTGRHGEHQSTVDKIISFLQKNKQISIKDLLQRVVIPVLLVIPEKQVIEIGTMKEDDVHKILIESAKKVEESFLKKLHSDFPALKEVDIRVLILPLGNYSQIVSHFEEKIVKVVTNGTF